VASFCGTTNGNVVLGRSATIGLIRSVSWPTSTATTKEVRAGRAEGSSV